MYVPFYLFFGCKGIFVVSFFCIDLLYLFLHDELGIHWCCDFFSVSVMSSWYSVLMNSYPYGLLMQGWC